MGAARLVLLVHDGEGEANNKGLLIEPTSLCGTGRAAGAVFFGGEKEGGCLAQQRPGWSRSRTDRLQRGSPPGVFRAWTGVENTPGGALTSPLHGVEPVVVNRACPMGQLLV